MRVLALTPNLKGHSPGQRSNIEIWAPRLLSDAGIEIVFEPFETERLHEILYRPGLHAAKAKEMARAYVNRLSLLKRIDEFDAVFVYREAALIGPAFLEKMAARKKPLIYNFDDPIFVPYKSPSNGYLSYLKFFGKTKEIIKISSVVIVNSSHLREYALQFNKNVRQIPNSFDPKVYAYRPFPEDIRPVCVGWSGSPSTLKNLELVAAPLKRLAEKVDYKFHAIGGTEINLPGVNFTAQNWREETEADDLRKMQIGLIPLPDVEWNKYKFIMKSAQYMALGIVPVGTPMASNPEVIRHGENGFLAATDDEWVEYTKILIEDAPLRGRMSAQAARDALDNYSLDATLPKVIEAFRSAVSRP
jgi:glycosyltransferase involved in cell wall biosynthesis